MYWWLLLTSLQNYHVLDTFDKAHNLLRLPRKSTSEASKLAFWTFSLGNVLCTTAACTFATSQLPKVVLESCAFYIFTWKCASCHNFQKVVRTPKFGTFWLGNVLRATTACTFSTSQLPNVVLRWCALCILTWKCASRYNCVRFLRHLNFQKCPRPSIFKTFDLEMCFAPHRHSLWHLNFQKWSERGVLLAFLPPSLLRATTAWNFSSLIWSHGSAPAALASLLFDPPEPQIIGKTRWIATCLPLRAPVSSFFSLFLLSDLLSSSLLLSHSCHLCLSICPYCGSLTSKLPLMIAQLCSNMCCAHKCHLQLATRATKQNRIIAWCIQTCLNVGHGSSSTLVIGAHMSTHFWREKYLCMRWYGLIMGLLRVNCGFLDFFSDSQIWVVYEKMGLVRLRLGKKIVFWNPSKIP